MLGVGPGRDLIRPGEDRIIAEALPVLLREDPRRLSTQQIDAGQQPAGGNQYGA